MEEEKGEGDVASARLLVTGEDMAAAFGQVRPSAMREVALDVPKVRAQPFTVAMLYFPTWRISNER